MKDEIFGPVLQRAAPVRKPAGCTNRFCAEQTVNTTAAGGNAALLAGG